ncbi:putative 7 kDa protein [Rose yellow leaf virus]|nr:putative 7 kDa protein [Rose yellow leaf virus]
MQSGLISTGVSTPWWTKRPATVFISRLGSVLISKSPWKRPTQRWSCSSNSPHLETKTTFLNG